jgi:small conductance mechanosensitive channel
MDDTSTAATSSVVESSPDLHRTALQSFNDLMNGNFSEGASALILKVIVPAAIALLMLVVTYFIARLISRWVAHLVCQRIDQTLGRFAGKLTFYAIMIMIGMTILQTAEVNVSGFAAIIAAAGFAIGLAFQGTLSNFASGILLLVFRPFKVGDLIQAAGVMGKVYEIDLFTTALDTLDNRRLIVPNSSIAGTTIENVTYHKHRRVEVIVGVAYAASLDETRRVLAASAESLGERLVTGENRGYQILLTNLGPHSVEWTVRAWANTSDFFATREMLTTEIKRQLDLHGLEIPFPQMQLHVRDREHPAISATRTDPVLPIPKLSKSEDEAGRTPRIRPRARGESV